MSPARRRPLRADNMPVSARSGHALAYVLKQRDGRGDPPPTTQIRDPFQAIYNEGQALAPPLPLERLLQLAEESSVHGACVNVKAVDAAGRGWHWEALDPEKTDEAVPQAIDARLEAITPDYTFTEMLMQAAWEKEALGWAAWEVIREPAGPEGAIAAIYPVPAQSLRARIDEQRFIQLRAGRRRHFVRFGSGLRIHRDTGSENPPDEDLAAEVILFRSYSPRSVYYGVPGWINIIPTLAELTAIREFNVSWFSSGGLQSRHIHVVAKSGEVAGLTAEAIREELASFQGIAHGTLVTHGTDDVKVDVAQLDSQVRDGHFRLRRGDLVKEVLMGHAVPPYRLGWAELGSLGGSAAKEMLDAYRYGSIRPLQVVLADRLNQTLFGPKGLDVRGYRFTLSDLDFDELATEIDVAIKGVQFAVLSPNEGRRHLHIEPDPDPMMDRKYYNGVPLTLDGAGVQSAANVVEEFTRALQKALEADASAEADPAEPAVPVAPPAHGNGQPEPQ